MTAVSVDEARRIAICSQLLDGSATSVLDTVRRIGYLQIDPISTVAPPQHLVLWSRLGSRYDRAELDRLLWEEKRLFEWAAFIRPIEDLPLVQARMRPHIILDKAQPNFLDPAGDGRVVMGQVFDASKGILPY